MDKIDIEVNKMIMEEIGLEIDSNNRIIDQDTGAAIAIKGMPVIAPGCYSRGGMEFDPYNNRKLMQGLFGYFLDKVSDESDVDVRTYYDVEDGNNKGHLECVMSDDTKLVSKSYNRDALKCIDIMSQLNGGSAPNLDKYDTMKRKESVKRGSTNGNKSNSKTAKNSK